MNKRFANSLLALALFVFTWTPNTSLAQDPVVKTQQTRKTFGFSLRDLKSQSEKPRSRTQKGGQAPVPAVPSDDVVKVEAFLAVFDFLVTDSEGKPVETLNRNDFSVSEDGVQQHITLFSKGDDIQNARSIILVLEWSNTAHYVEKSLEAAQTFIEQLGPRDEVAVVTSDINLVCDFTNDRQKLRTALSTLKDKISERPNHSLPAEIVLPKVQFEFETLIAVLQELINTPRRHIIIFQTDGGEALYLRDQPLAKAPVPPPVRTISLADVLSAVIRSRATIYSIIPDYRYLALSPDAQMNRARESMKDQVGYLPDSQQRLFLSTPKLRNIIDSAVLAQSSLMRVASLSGGWASFLERPDQAAYIYSRILTDANQRYVLAYPVTDKIRDGRVRNVRIEVQGHPEYHIQGRQSYSIR
jgi:VWFA-related protein